MALHGPSALPSLEGLVLCVFALNHALACLAHVQTSHHSNPYARCLPFPWPTWRPRLSVPVHQPGLPAAQPWRAAAGAVRLRDGPVRGARCARRVRPWIPCHGCAGWVGGGAGAWVELFSYFPSGLSALGWPRHLLGCLALLSLLAHGWCTFVKFLRGRCMRPATYEGIPHCRQVGEQYAPMGGVPAWHLAPLLGCYSPPDASLMLCLVLTPADACATYSQARHDNSLRAVAGYCRQRSTREVEQELAAAAATSPGGKAGADDDGGEAASGQQQVSRGAS